ncbi:helix-turn-helix domain-containing protein [Lentzea kentuckyensis]|uniref:helix-turn-helix domain-containing protein n=1 Tax=Lentzea kentuckyensis TaxID=360086 RepID=UPI001302DB3A|nr:helix-turn-helix transcriptional regulator [Lentzea kentuckyensis]
MTGEHDNTSGAQGRKRLGLRETRKLGRLIREAREAVPLTREEVQAAIGLSETSQYNVEAGERRKNGKKKPHRIHTGTLVSLAKLIGLTPQQLADCGRDEAAALLRAPLLPGGLSDDDKAEVAASLLTLRRLAPDFETMIRWIGTATGDLPASPEDAGNND